jgi:hypothetical protein
MAILLCRVSFLLNVIYAECHKKALYAECRYTECRYAECRGATLSLLYKLLTIPHSMGRLLALLANIRLGLDLEVVESYNHASL